MKLKVTASIIGLILASNAYAGSFDIEEQRTLNIQAADLSKFKVDVGAGFLKIEGSSSLSEIQVVADLQVDEDNFKLTLEQSGDSAILVADANSNNRSNWWGDGPKIDLTIKVPYQMMLDINDGSGFIEVKAIGGGLKLNDGSGSISLNDIEGDVDVKDGSGSFSIENLKGSLVLDDGSGSIRIQQVTGNVKVDDGSGSTLISKVGGTVEVDDGSGSLTVEDITGHVTIDDGSGGINLNRLANGVTILNEGSGGLSMNDVQGAVKK
ncbi:hypothetical protein [Pleionea litopenaei]|uniref:Adhesin n=1 Tax=Pleionea litopenaei TaxID=3070815 RepID=A0AA51X8L2_9GAMM|nr:hypothetical protein [Pleionea sp. HL-JVS1]WMS88195.1 hypothetical protein Q9312_04590 [Pleionea sp. HL-JVS1]